MALSLDPADILAEDRRAGTLIGRAWLPGAGSAVAIVREGGGFVLFLGPMFAPIEDRDMPGQGFTDKTGDIVTLASAKLGAPAPMRNLAQRGLR